MQSVERQGTTNKKFHEWQQVGQKAKLLRESKPEGKLLLEVWLDCIPPKTTHQAALTIFKNRDGRQFIGRTKKGRANAHFLKTLLLPFKPKIPFSYPLMVEVIWAYPDRKSEPKKNRGKVIPCQTRPDCDNLVKALFDAMTEAEYWTDDNIVYQLDFRKVYADPHGISVTIRG